MKAEIDEKVKSERQEAKSTAATIPDALHSSHTDGLTDDEDDAFKSEKRNDKYTADAALLKVNGSVQWKYYLISL